nr:MAG TPA: hypothetical protein [Caudoviricetes sp.]
MSLRPRAERRTPRGRARAKFPSGNLCRANTYLRFPIQH